MVRFLIMAGFVLLFLFVTAVLVSLGLWVVVHSWHRTRKGRSVTRPAPGYSHWSFLHCFYRR